MNAEIVVVSGLPRSGTSLMMRLLDAGGIPAVTDGIRAADIDNPRGYYEYEPVKTLKSDASWLPSARGKALKAVSQLLYDLPTSEQYRVIFMERDMDEVLASQEKMLIRRGQSAPPHGEIAPAFARHLAKLHDWLAGQAHFTVLRIAFAKLIAQPAEQVVRINEFLDGRLNEEIAIAAVDPSLHRNRIAPPMTATSD
jgi:hypothetical protein